MTGAEGGRVGERDVYIFTFAVHGFWLRFVGPEPTMGSHNGVVKPHFHSVEKKARPQLFVGS